MAVLERDELEASPLADLHAIADQLGLDGFRRLRKGALVDMILGEESAGEDGGADEDEDVEGAEQDGDAARGEAAADRDRSPTPRSRRRGGRASAARARRPAGAGRSEGERDAGAAAGAEREADAAGESTPALAEGVVELLDNGSAFLRVTPPDPSDGDIYISAAQVRRCELVSGDRVAGPVRTPRRSERYPSLVRIDTINGEPAESVSDGVRYDDLPVVHASEHLSLGSRDPTLEAIEWLVPLGRGSRAVIVGAARAGKTETLRRLLEGVANREELSVSLVLVGVRPEEIAEWQSGPVAPAAALSFAVSADLQGQAVERAVEEAKRVAARGGDALLLIDSLDGLHPHAARKALAAARKLRDAGSLTIIATASRPFGGESTVIALDPALRSIGREPTLDLINSGTLRAELLVGEEGAHAITQARATAVESRG